MYRLVVLLSCCLAVLTGGQESTVRPVSMDDDAAQIETEAETKATVPSVTPYIQAPIPVASTDLSSTFRKVPNVECSDAVGKQVAQIYSKNRELFDACTERTKYQIFPYSGQLPTQQQIYALSTTKACTALFTACVLANMPQCDIGALGLKSATETLLKVTVDVDNGLPAPDPQLFHEIQNWRRGVNLAQAAGLPFGNDSQLYREFTHNLWTALTKYNVRVLPDLAIVYNTTDLTSAINGTELGGIRNAVLANTTMSQPTAAALVTSAALRSSVGWFYPLVLVLVSIGSARSLLVGTSRTSRAARLEAKSCGDEQ